MLKKYNLITNFEVHTYIRKRNDVKLYFLFRVFFTFNYVDKSIQFHKLQDMCLSNIFEFADDNCADIA